MEKERLNARVAFRHNLAVLGSESEPEFSDSIFEYSTLLCCCGTTATNA